MKTCPTCFTECDDATRYCSNCGEGLDAVGAADSELIGKTIAGKYLIEKMIGTGAMGAIYKAEQVSLGMPVAIKVLHRHLLSDKTLSKRFHREARAASKIDHANCIRVIDFGQADNGVLYIAMEMVEGRDLAEVLFRDFPLDDRRIIQVAKQICLALDEAHANGVIHRDLKPENIMLNQRRNNADVVKVLDFGIAKLSEKARGDDEEGGFETVAGVVCGTPEYMSPEQARGEKLDGRSDLYSLGIILYQLLTNTLPFTADTAIAVVTKHLTDTAQDPRMLRGDCNPELADMAMYLMNKKISDRPADALATHRLLEKIEASLGEKRTSTLVGGVGAILPETSGSTDKRAADDDVAGPAPGANEAPTMFVTPQQPVPTPVGTAMRMEVARVRNRSVLPWAVTALAAVAVSAYVLTSPGDDKPTAPSSLDTTSAQVASAPPSVKPRAPVARGKGLDVSPKGASHRSGAEPEQATGITRKPVVQKPAMAVEQSEQAQKPPVGEPVAAAKAMPASLGTARQGGEQQKTRVSTTTTPTSAKKKATKKRSEKRARPKKESRAAQKPTESDGTQGSKKEQLKALLAKARTAKRSGSWSAVIQAYRAALQISPRRRYFKELGHAYRKSGSMSKACRYYRKYVRGLKGQRQVDAKASLAVYQCNL